MRQSPAEFQQFFQKIEAADLGPCTQQEPAAAKTYKNKLTGKTVKHEPLCNVSKGASGDIAL
jgi:hypothetical protein